CTYYQDKMQDDLRTMHSTRNQNFTQGKEANLSNSCSAHLVGLLFGCWAFCQREFLVCFGLNIDCGYNLQTQIDLYFRRQTLHCEGYFDCISLFWRHCSVLDKK